MIGKKILILDDIPENTIIIKRLLEKHGIEGITCNSGQEALEIIKKRSHIDALVTDLRMPGMSGQEVIMAVRNFELEEELASIPIIVVSAESDTGERILCLSKYGANDFLLKPIKLADLLLSLYKALMNIGPGRKRILIVEDEAVSNLFMKKTLEDNKQIVKICENITDVRFLFRFT